MDAIYLAVEGQQKGPYTLNQIQQLCANGEINRELPAWYDGLANWITVGQVLTTFPDASPAPPPPVNPASSSVAPGEFSNDELRDIAKKQNLLMWSVLAGFGGFFIAHIPFLGLPLLLAIVAFQIYALYSLGTSLRMSIVWLYCIGLFIPLVGLLILLVISGKASKVLKAAGVRIGLMGGNADDIKD